MVEQETQNDEGASSGDKQLFCECVDCKSKIAKAAKKCAVCHSFQNRSRHFLSLAPALSLIVAIIALLPATVNLVVSSLSDKSPRYSVLSFFPDNIAGPNGKISQPVAFSISAQITNLSEETLVVDDSLNCGIRRGITLSEEKSPSESNVITPVTILGQAGFNLYFENTVKTVIPAHSTHTVSWNVTDEQYVELDKWHTWEPREATKFSALELKPFYDAILAEFSDAGNLKSKDNFPRGAKMEDGRVISFFLNLDCSFYLENSFSEQQEDLHLEFVFEFSGDHGIYPRWRMGKNIGGGFGNGFGNGAGEWLE